MARLKLSLPDKSLFQTELKIEIGHINYGGHLGNDSVLTLCHEMRLRFLKERGWSELNIEGRGLIMTDSQVLYKAEAFHGDNIEASLYVSDITDYGFDFYYGLKLKESSKEVARCKTGMAFFDYEKRKLSKTPDAFKKLAIN